MHISRALTIVASFYLTILAGTIPPLQAQNLLPDSSVQVILPDTLSGNEGLVRVRVALPLADSLIPPRRRSPLDLTRAHWKRTVSHDSFQIGEELVYKVKFGPLTAGEARLSIRSITQFDGRPVYEIVSTIQTASGFSRIYQVKDLVRSLVDVDGIFSWYIEEHLREGRYNADRWIILNQKEGLAYNDRDTVAIAPFTQDVLSIIYFIRSQSLQDGKIIQTENIANMKRYPVDVHISQSERIRVKAGEFDCFQVEPRYRPGFQQTPKGRMELWVSNDSRKLPIRIITRLPFGSLKMELESFSGVTPLITRTD
ncbi:DUF3108 domain-containing protein [candidate division KSB1 bacterium]|nr:DUF3108 domain-containing protein [candidate division KSB1 bacterium]